MHDLAWLLESKSRRFFFGKKLQWNWICLFEEEKLLFGPCHENKYFRIRTREKKAKLIFTIDLFVANLKRRFYFLYENEKEIQLKSNGNRKNYVNKCTNEYIYTKWKCSCFKYINFPHDRIFYTQKRKSKHKRDILFE